MKTAHPVGQISKASRIVAAPFRCRLVIMAKVPDAGRVKTRLAREIGSAAATRFARQALAATLSRVWHRGPWETILAVAPDSGVSRHLGPTGIDIIPQGGGNLGDRMQRIMDRAPPGPLVIIGTDIPGIQAVHIRRAFALLGQHDAVFGPAVDGGYWLVGLKRRPRVPRPFGLVRWSSRHALADTLANLRGSSVARVALLADVDSAADIAHHKRMIGRRVLPAD